MTAQIQRGLMALEALHGRVCLACELQKLSLALKGLPAILDEPCSHEGPAPEIDGLNPQPQLEPNDKP